jgi:hypothetical protein
MAFSKKLKLMVVMLLFQQGLPPCCAAAVRQAKPACDLRGRIPKAELALGSGG